MSDFKNGVIKMMSKSPSRHVVRLQGKLKLKKKYTFLNVNNIFSIFQYTVADLGRSVNHVKHLISSCLQDVCFVNFALGREGCSPAALPPLVAPMYLTQDSKIRYHD